MVCKGAFIKMQPIEFLVLRRLQIRRLLSTVDSIVYLSKLFQSRLKAFKKRKSEYFEMHAYMKRGK